MRLAAAHSTAGGFSGTAEAVFYVNNLQNKVEIPKGAAACANGFTGTIMGQAVAVLTTGTPLTAVLCPHNNQCSEPDLACIWLGSCLQALAPPQLRCVCLTWCRPAGPAYETCSSVALPAGQHSWGASSTTQPAHRGLPTPTQLISSGEVLREPPPLPCAAGYCPLSSHPVHVRSGPPERQLLWH